MTNILDTVEPDSIADGFDRDMPLYSRETVERLLAENTKQTLLKAAEVCKSHEIDDEETFADIGYNNGCGRCATELRRMAEGEK